MASDRTARLVEELPHEEASRWYRAGWWFVLDDAGRPEAKGPFKTKDIAAMRLLRRMGELGTPFVVRPDRQVAHGEVYSSFVEELATGSGAYDGDRP